MLHVGNGKPLRAFVLASLLVGGHVVFRFLGRIYYGLRIRFTELRIRFAELWIRFAELRIRFAELDGGPAGFLQAVSARWYISCRGLHSWDLFVIIHGAVAPQMSFCSSNGESWC